MNRMCRSSLKERGRSRGTAGLSLAFSVGAGYAEVRRRGQGSGVARPRSGRRALTPAPFGAAWATEKGGCGPLFVSKGVGALLSSMPVSRQIAAVERAARHPFAAQVGGMMGFAVPAGRWGQSEGATTPRVGGHDLHDPHRPAVRVTACHAATGRVPCSARTWWSRRA